jgi:hypothetical protein
VNESKFIWTVGEHMYILVPEVRQSPRRSWLLGAGMYNMDGDYVGYWHRRQMPIPLIRDLSAYARKDRAAKGLPTYVAVSAYKRRKAQR